MCEGVRPKAHLYLVIEGGCFTENQGADLIITAGAGMCVAAGAGRR
jgi:hypothetical protein